MHIRSEKSPSILFISSILIFEIKKLEGAGDGKG